MPDAIIPSPFLCDKFYVLKEWIDLNGHMNVAYYLKAFDMALNEPYEQVGFTAEHMALQRGTTFAAEIHISYQCELMEGDPLRIATQLLGFDAKRMHWMQGMYHRDRGYLAATAEWLILYVDIGLRRVGRMPEDMQRRFRALQAAHAQLAVPKEAGRRIEFTGRRQPIS